MIGMQRCSASMAGCGARGGYRDCDDASWKLARECRLRSEVDATGRPSDEAKKVRTDGDGDGKVEIEDKADCMGRPKRIRTRQEMVRA